MPAPVFGFDQFDPHAAEGGGAPASLNTNSTNQAPNGFWYDYFRQQAGQPAPTPVFNTTNQDQARLQQQQVIQDLQRAAAGDPNSRAQQQLQQASAGAQSQQSSLGSTMRGQSAGAAQRSIQAGQQDIARQLPGDQQMLMAQEQQGAQSLLAQILAQQQGQDISQAQAMGNITLGGQALDDQTRGFYLGGALSADLAATDNENAVARARAGFNDQMRSVRDELIKGGVQAVGTGAATGMNFYGSDSPHRGSHLNSGYYKDHG